MFVTNHFNRGRTAPAFLALSCVGFIASAPAYAAPDDETQRVAPDAQEIVVSGVREGELESPKATAKLVDTPQTITVIGDQTIRKQNLLTLRDALQTIPGITFGAGEGGGGYGDSINLRGFSANNDITQDGVRDSAQYSRTETFNLESIEVYNGANSVFNGAGSVGGTINLVTKTPKVEDLTIVQAGVGTDRYLRGTIDANRQVADNVAVRLNAVVHRNDVPGRDVERMERWAVAPSVRIGLNGATSLVVQYLHQEDDNVPSFGVPYYQTATNNGALPGVDDSDYFGIRNLDGQDITVDQATVRFEHALSDSLALRNLTRWQRVGQNTVTSAPQGAYCLSGGVVASGAACAAGQLPGFYYPSGPRGFVRNQENQLLYNQTDLKGTFNTFGLSHSAVIGVSFTQEDYTLATGNLLRTAAGGTVAQPPIDFGNPDTTYTGPVNFIQSARSQGDTRNAAVYFFDTVKIVPQLEASVGVRYENQQGRFRPGTFATSGPALGAYTRGAEQVSDEMLFSYRFGLNFKPVETVSLYASYGNARTPTSATVRLGCGSAITTPGGSVDPCDVSPETARNYEIGGKADLFGRKLQLTAALFRNERANFRVNTNDPVAPSLPVNDGRSRVDGIALGATGNITRAWSIFANYTYLDSEVMQSVSNYCLANPGPRADNTNPCGNSASVVDPAAGSELTQTPRHSGSLFTTYTLPFGLQLGYGLTYQGSFTLNAPTLANATVYRSDDYLVHRAFASYPLMPGVTAQVNVQNFTDERYYTGIRNNGWAVPGERAQAVASLYFSF